MAIAMPTVSEDKKSIGTFPTARRKIAAVKTISATEITRLVPPIRPTKGIKKALAAKHNTVNEVKNDRRNELKWYCSLRIGIRGLIMVNPARIFIAAIKIGRPLTIACLLLKADSCTA